MRYNITTGVQSPKINVKKIIAEGAATVGLAAGLALPTLAATGGNDYGEQPEYSKASACGQAHGAYSYFDGDTNLGSKSLGPGTPVYHGGATGQEPGATGYNNSQVDCQ